MDYKTKTPEGNNVWLMKGDCLERMKEIPDGSVDLVLTDPPYTMTKRGKSCRPNWMSNNMGDSVFNSPIPDVEKWFFEVFRVLKHGTHFYTFCNTNDLSRYLVAAKKVGFKFHNLITIVKDTGMPNRWYYKQCELVLFFRKGRAKPINDMTSRDNINVIMPKKSTGKLHITEKPMDLITRFVTNSTQHNEVVLDLFMGSGTTGAACANTGRNFIGIELDDNYFDVAKRRINGELIDTTQNKLVSKNDTQV